MFNGDIAEKDWVQAYALMTRASAQGLPQASRSLATMDKYIPMAERTKGTQLAAQLERQAAAERQKLAGAAAGLARPAPASPATSSTASASPASAAPVKQPIRPAPAPSTIQTTSLPPSTATGTMASAPPASGTGTAATAGVDFANSGAPSGTAAPPAPASTPAPAPAAPAPAATTSAAPVVAASGDWRIQLGAFSDEGRARTLWSGLEQQNAALQGLQPYLVKSGAITKLQAGPFASQAAAQKACASVARAGQACFALKR
jgi:cell division septation protein DedD